MSDLSTKPYLIRAIHEWCIDSGYRPHIAVVVDENTEVPFDFVRNGEIVLNVAPEATQHLVMGNDRIEFEARFNRVARRVSVPVANVIAVYASENGHGMAFEVPKAPAVIEPERSPRTSRTLRDVTPARVPAAAPSESSQADAEPPAKQARRRRAEPKLAADSVGVADSAAPAKSAAPAMTLVPDAQSPSDGSPTPPSSPPAPSGGRPHLTRVK